MVFILTVKEDIMQFETIQIRNFRNFKDIKIKLSNKNVFFGMNDVGKTNFLFALRFVFDKSIRKNGFSNSDFYNKDTSSPIEIIVKINIKDINDETMQKSDLGLKEIFAAVRIQFILNWKQPIMNQK